MKQENIYQDDEAIKRDQAKLIFIIKNYILDHDYGVWSIINNKEFLHASGSGWVEGKKKHHYGRGGLLRHTVEVVENCISIAKVFGIENVKMKELIIAAIYHDYGKVYDYKVSEDGRYLKTVHHKNIHHITRGVLLFDRTNYLYHVNNPDERFDYELVIHCILSHHGCREWGSPVRPNTIEAYILHYSDSLSARLDEKRVD